MRNRFFVRCMAAFLALLQLVLLLPAMPVSVSAAESTAPTKKPLPFAYSNAAAQTEKITMSGTSYSDAILFTMGYTGYGNGATGEVTYNFKGKYSSLTFSAGYVKGHERNAKLTVIADGVVLKDEVEIKYTDVAKKYTISLSGVSSLTIRFYSDAYDKTYYAIANVTATPASGAKADETRVSDEFYYIPNYLLTHAEQIDGAFSMGGYDYENGYKAVMGYGFGKGYTAKIGFNFNNQYKKMTFDIAKYMNRASETYTRSAYLTIEADGTVLSGYDKKELKWNDIALPVTVNLSGVTQLVITVNSDGYDTVNWAIGNIQLVSDGKAHGILLDKASATVTTAAPTVDLNPRVYPSDAKNKKFTIESDCKPLVSVDKEGIVTGHYKGTAVITATTDEGGFTAACNITSKLPQFKLENTYHTQYVDDTGAFIDESYEYLTIVGSGDGGLAGDLARAYVDAGRVITDGYGGAINGLDAVMDLKIEVENDFDFVMSDLLAGEGADDLMEGILNEEMLDTMSDVLLFLGYDSEIATQFAVAEAVTDFGELPDVMSSEVQKHWASLKKTFTSQVTYENAGKMFTALGGAVDLADAVAAGCEDVGELMEYYVLCNAYANASDAYAKVITESAAKMKGKNAIMSPALTEAAETLKKAMKDAVEENNTTLYLTCGTELAQFTLRSGQIVSDLVDGFTGHVSVYSAIRSGVKMGTSLSNWMTSTDDRYKYGKMLHMAGFFAEGMHEVVLERQAAFEKNPTYDNAEAFSAATELYLNLQIIACDYAISYFNSYATSFLGRIFKYTVDDEVAMAEKFVSYKADLMRLRDSDCRVFFDQDGSISGFVAACPVTVIVETKDGQEIARLETGKMTVAEGYEWAYRLLGSKHEHKTGFYDPAIHNVTIIAEGDGTMSLLEYTGTEDGITMGSTYVDVPVKKGETYKISQLSLVKDGQKIKHDAIYPESAAANPFVDINESMFCYDAVLWAYYGGITTGKDATHFNPSGDCTRSQVVTFLWRAAGEPEPKSLANPFPDVPEGKFYTKAVLWAVEQGITAGYKDGTFGPNDACTRGQIVTFLWRYFEEPEPNSLNNPFPDVLDSKFYYKAVLWAVENGITGGFKDGTFGPNKTCKRDQIVTFLYRAMVE